MPFFWRIVTTKTNIAGTKITVTYSQDEIPIGFDKTRLKLFKRPIGGGTNAWVAVADSEVDTLANTLMGTVASVSDPFSALNFDYRDPDDSFASLKGCFRINGLRVFQAGIVGKGLNPGDRTAGTRVASVGADIQGNVYFTIDTTANEVRLSHRPQFSEKRR
jgi:hypothetical protein